MSSVFLQVINFFIDYFQIQISMTGFDDISVKIYGVKIFTKFSLSFGDLFSEQLL